MTDPMPEPDKKRPPRLTHFPDPRLFRPCKKVERFDESLDVLSKFLAETMVRYEGVGLAANQAGDQDIQMFVMVLGIEDETQSVLTVVNPEILEFGEWIDSAEGCLSMPGIVTNVKRRDWVRVAYQDTKGNTYQTVLDGLTARIFQHETDHLNGYCLWHKMDQIERKNNGQYIALLAGPYLDDPSLSKDISKLARKEFSNARIKTNKR